MKEENKAFVVGDYLPEKLQKIGAVALWCLLETCKNKKRFNLFLKFIVYLANILSKWTQ